MQGNATSSAHVLEHAVGADMNGHDDELRSTVQDDTLCLLDSLGLLFGAGVAFPQDVVDGGGGREPWVGFKRSAEQTDLMVLICDDILSRRRC